MWFPRYGTAVNGLRKYYNKWGKRRQQVIFEIRNQSSNYVSRIFAIETKDLLDLIKMSFIGAQKVITNE